MKIIITLILLLLTANTSNGAVSGDMSEYVRKEVYDVQMESFMKELRGEFQVINTKLEALSRRIDDNYRNQEKKIEDSYQSLESRLSETNQNLSSRIDDMKQYIYLVLVLLGVVIVLPSVQKFLEWRESRKPLITLEDVKRLIDENNAELLKSLRT